MTAGLDWLCMDAEPQDRGGALLFFPQPSTLPRAQTLLKAVPEKYSHIDFKPTAGMAKAAARGLALREEFGRGGTAIGVARARDIKNRKNLSPKTVSRTHRFFERFKGERGRDGWGSTTDPSNAYIAWLLWGGDAGRSWARKRFRQMKAADEKAKKHQTDAVCRALFGLPDSSIPSGVFA